MTEAKTSTFIIDHERCDPSRWTASDVVTFDHFMKTGDINFAPHLAALGVRVVASEHFVPKGGTVQKVGWLYGDGPAIGEFTSEIEDAVDQIGNRDSVTELVPVFAGLPEYVVSIPIGDADGMLEGYEYEFKPTKAEAEEYARQIYDQTSE